MEQNKNFEKRKVTYRHLKKLIFTSNEIFYNEVKTNNAKNTGHNIHTVKQFTIAERIFYSVFLFKTQICK